MFRHLNFSLTIDQIQKLSNGQDQNLIEYVLLQLKNQIDGAIQQGRFRPSNRRSCSSASSRSYFLLS